MKLAVALIVLGFALGVIAGEVSGILICLPKNVYDTPAERKIIKQKAEQAYCKSDLSLTNKVNVLKKFNGRRVRSTLKSTSRA